MSTSINLNQKKQNQSLRGLSSILYKESCDWMKTKKWWINAILWPVIICGLVANLLLVANSFPVDISEEVVAAGGLTKYITSLGLSVFFDFGMRVIGFGVIILSHDLLISERENGIFEWMLTKPISRRATIFGKLLANGKYLMLFLILIPAAITYGMLSLKMGGFFPVPPYLAGLGIMVLHSFFYMALVLMLGTIINSRIAVLGISAGLLLGGSILTSLVDFLVYVSPFALSSIATMVADSKTIAPEMLVLPIVSTLLWSIIFLVVAIYKFDRLEI